MENRVQFGISGNGLKIFAIIIMFIDHFAAIILERMLSGVQGLEIYPIYMNLRFVGRLAFPIFCFLLIEGMVHTRNQLKYIGHLVLFAIISEIPFDLAFRGTYFTMDYQNVFFTLGIGALCIYFMEKCKANHFVVRLVLTIIIGAGGMYAAYLLNTDYNYAGVATILCMYFLYGKPVRQGIGGCALLTLYNATELYAFPSVILMKFYNGTRGKQIKYLFYVFYPAHILILYGIAQWLVP